MNEIIGKVEILGKDKKIIKMIDYRNIDLLISDIYYFTKIDVTFYLYIYKNVIEYKYILNYIKEINLSSKCCVVIK